MGLHPLWWPKMDIISLISGTQRWSCSIHINKVLVETLHFRWIPNDHALVSFEDVLVAALDRNFLEPMTPIGHACGLAPIMLA